MHTRKAQIRAYLLTHSYLARYFISPRKIVTLSKLCHYAGIDVSSCSPTVQKRMNRVVNQISMVDPEVSVYPPHSICVVRNMEEAMFAMSHKPIALLSDKQFGDYPCLVVSNVSETYSKMCHYYRALNKRIHITAVTGSIGKTTTKGIIASVYSAYDKKTLYTPANDNSPSMVGYAVQHIPSRCKLMVQEVLENMPNETGYMSMMLEPRVAVISAIDNSHFEAFGSVEGILNEICSIVKGLQPQGCVIIDKQDFSRVAELLKGKRVITVSDSDTTADYYAENIKVSQYGLLFDVVDKAAQVRQQVKLVNIYARHNVSIALRAFAAGRSEGIPYTVIAEGLAQYRTMGYRQNVIWTKSGICLYADCYNAIASSIRAALVTADNIPVKGKRIALLGDIAECGALSDEEHDNVVQSVNESSFNVLLPIGEKINAAVSRCTMRPDLQCLPCATHDEAIRHIKSLVQSGDLLLVKASASGRLEKVIKSVWPEEYGQMISPYIKRRRAWEFYSAVH